MYDIAIWSHLTPKLRGTWWFKVCMQVYVSVLLRIKMYLSCAMDLSKFFVDKMAKRTCSCVGVSFWYIVSENLSVIKLEFDTKRALRVGYANSSLACC